MLPRPEVEFFVQMFVILLLIPFCIVKLTVVNQSAEQIQFGYYYYQVQLDIFYQIQDYEKYFINAR